MHYFPKRLKKIIKFVNRLFYEFRNGPEKNSGDKKKKAAPGIRDSLCAVVC
jgi:hypothetical protein